MSSRSLADHLGASLGLVVDDAVPGAVGVEQRDKPLVGLVAGVAGILPVRRGVRLLGHAYQPSLNICLTSVMRCSSRR